MSALSFDSDKLGDRLSRLSKRHILTFGVWQLERMVPNFIQFCIETQSAGVWVLKSAVSYGWSVIETGSTHRLNVLTSDMCTSVAPDTEDFNSIYTSSALDAANSAANLLDYIDSNDVQLVIEMASLARDSADLFIQISGYVTEDSKEFETRIKMHPLMQSELRHQESDIEFLERLPHDSDKFFQLVVARSLDEPYGMKWL